MNALAALWRFLGFRWGVAMLSGLATSALLAGAHAPPGAVIAAAVLPPLWVAGRERIGLLGCWRRWLFTGRGAAGDWMSPLELKRHTRPLPEKLR